MNRWNQIRYPISILKPIKGLDSGLEENLKSFMRIEYPDFEILFSVAEANDPCLPVIERVRALYPNVKTTLIIGDQKITANPKVNNMILSYEKARHDWILISDSNVRVPRNYLSQLSQLITKKTGVISGVVCGIHPKGLGGALEAAYLNTFYIRFVRLAMHFGKPCVIGKSMLFKKSVADVFGGLKTFGLYLAEDYMFGEAVRKIGLSVQIMPFPVEQHIGNYSFMDFWHRHLRWGRIRRAQAFFATLLEPLICSYIITLLFAFSYLKSVSSLSNTCVFSIHTAIWFGNEYFMFATPRVTAKLKNILYAFIRELVYIPLWLVMISGNSVFWRGQTIRVASGGMISNDFVTGRSSLWKNLIQQIKTFFGEWRQVLIRLKAKMMRMIGGIGKSQATLKAASVQDWLATTGTDFVRIFDLPKILHATPIDFHLNGRELSRNLEKSTQQPYPGIKI